MSFLTLVSVYIMGTIFPTTTPIGNVDEQQLIESFRHAYLVGINGHIEKLDSRYEVIAASEESRKAHGVEDADLLPDSSRIILALWSDPPFAVISTETLERVSLQVDLADTEKSPSGNEPHFIAALTPSSFYYSGYPEDLIIDLQWGKAAKPQDCSTNANAKDGLLVSPDGKFMFVMSKDGNVSLCNLGELAMVRRLTDLFPEHYGWVARLDINWLVPSLKAVYVVSIPTPPRPVEIQIDWATGEVRKADTTMPNNVARILKAARGEEFLAAYGSGARSGNNPVIYGRLERAVTLMGDNSLKNMPKLAAHPYWVKAFLSNDGRIAAFVTAQPKGEEKASDTVSTVTFIDLATGDILREMPFPEMVVSVLFE